MGPGHFTSGGHFIVLRGVTLTGKLLVADPVSDERSLMEWDPQLILDELSASRHNGAPLWVISPPPLQSQRLRVAPDPLFPMFPTVMTEPLVVFVRLWPFRQR